MPAGHFDKLPVVTIQLPIYNEMYVADRLIDAVCADRLPARPARDPGPRRFDRRDASDCRAGGPARRAAQGVDIKYLHRTIAPATRPARSKPGCKIARGEFIAIFDADFIPARDFLQRTIHHFTDPKVGDGAGALGPHQPGLLAADARSSRSCSTAHFVLEHGGRNRAGHFFNFNGTAGIWRRDGDRRRGRLAARHADRGSRPQLSRAAARLEVRSSCRTSIAPAELPVEMNAFKSQQHRWAKGSIQTCRKLLPRDPAGPTSRSA